MADQTAQRDQNRVTALLVHDSTGAETRQVRATAANPNAVPVEVLATAPGTGASSLGKAEDAAHASGDVGIEMLTKRTDTAASSAGTDGDYATLNTDSTGHTWVREGFAPGYEDNTANVAKVEHRYSYSRATADTQVKGSAGFLHTLTFACSDAAPTAGSIIVYDSLTETGTIIYSETFDTTAFRGYTVTLDVSFATGLYVGFTTTADVGVTASYR